MKRQLPTKGSMPSTTPTTAKPAQTSIGGELSRTQRAVLRAIRKDGPGTEAEIFQSGTKRVFGTMANLRDDLAELESRALVRCAAQPNGRRIWGMP